MVMCIKMDMTTLVIVGREREVDGGGKGIEEINGVGKNIINGYFSFILLRFLCKFLLFNFENFFLK